MNKDRILELEKNILKARMDYYNNDQNQVSDKVFDAWVDELKQFDGNNKAILSIGAIPVSDWKKAKHQIPMGSLDKVNTPEEMAKWATDVAKDEDLFVTEKLDGISIEVIYENGKLVQGITRGDGEIGEDITVNVIKMAGVPSQLKGNDAYPQKRGVSWQNPMFTGSLRGEIIMLRSNHKEFFSDKANPRNAASGVAKRLDGLGVEYLNVIFYQALGDVDFGSEVSQFKWLKSQGAAIPNYWLMDTVDEVNKHWRDYQDAQRKALDYDIDGLVVRINDMANQQSLGDKDLRPKGAKAFKFDNEGRETIITKIDWQVGNSGRLTPVAHFNKINLCGADIEKASIYNVAYINELQLDVGAKVIVVRANEVIPRVEELVKGTGSIHQPPKQCPECSCSVKMIGENLICINSLLCPSQVIGRIKNWVSELNILELGESLIEKLVQSKLVSNVSDLYTLKVSELSSLDRMGDKSAENVYNSLWSKNPVPLDLFLGGLSISMIGSSTIKLLMEAGYDELDKILEMKLSEIEAIKGIGPIKANSLFEGLEFYRDVIESLLENGVKIKKKIIGSLSGKSFCFTGSMVNKRAFLEDKVINGGGTLKSSVSKGLTHLVIADISSSSSKAVAARKLGTVLISEDDFLKMT